MKNAYHKLWMRAAVLVYRASLVFYPRDYQKRFGGEMTAIFSDALEEKAQQGGRRAGFFMLREYLDAPSSIISQYLEAKSGRQNYVLAFTIGFGLFGLANVIFEGQDNLFRSLTTILILAVVGGVTGLAIASAVEPEKMKTFGVCGAAGFLLANTLGEGLFRRLFHFTPLMSGIGWEFFMPFLCPILQGIIFGLFLGAAQGTWRGLLRWSSISSLAFLAGFFLNRLSASLLQSYVVKSATQDIFLTGAAGLVFFILIPYLLQGLLLGILFGKASHGRLVTG
jgi:hypothetical protein